MKIHILSDLHLEVSDYQVHMHDSLDYTVEGTRVICNPRGYTRIAGREENGSFNPELMVMLMSGKGEDHE